MTNVELVAKDPIAIVGMGCVLPDAPDVKSFWDNILAGRSSIHEVPPTRWDPALYWSTDKSVQDRTYAKIGGFVSDDAFNGLDYRMPPAAVSQVDPSQRWVLASTRQALLDAGLATGLKADEGKTARSGAPLRAFDRNKTAIMLGNAMGGELQKETSRRVYWPEAAAAIRRTPEFQALPADQQKAMLSRAEADYKARLLPVTEDTMPGSLSNVAAGRVANVFDLAGKNFTTDAACASSLAALDAAVQTLQRREADTVVWGGTDRSMDVSSYIQFSKIGALSPDGSRPFDANANGFVMGEGCGIFILKRLADAERDGDRVYAVVRGVGASSDGKGKGITAPNPAGQVKAVLRAYEDAAVDPATLGLLEAHGTSTPVGDPVELQSVMDAFAQTAKAPLKPGAIAVGSVKGNIGHLKAGAGAAGLLKAALALHNKVLPPSINVKTLNPRIDWAKSPFKVQTQAEPWPQPSGHPRRAAVSSFGFGGTNFHVVLEEHVPGRLQVAAQPQAAPAAQPRGLPSAMPASAAAQVTTIDVAAFQTSFASRATLEQEPVVLDGATAAEGAASIMGAAVTFPKDPAGRRLRDVVRGPTESGIKANARVAFSVADPSDVAKKLDQAQKALTNPAQARLAFQQGVFLGRGAPQGKVAFLFPGQGTQYVNMFRDLAQKYEVVRNTFHEADEVLMSELDGVKLTDILWPTPDTPETQAASEKKLQLTEFTQPAVLAADVAMLRLLRQWGIEPHVVAGHSLGEYGALVAAGVLSFPDALHAVAARGREMAHVEVPDLGKMASVSADWTTVEAALKGMTEYVIPANKNCPSQTVIAGSSKGVDEAVKLLQGKGLQAQYLPVSAAFHSAIVAPASKPLRNVLARLDVKSPKVRCLSNVGTHPYQDDPEWIRDNLATQVASPVEWIGIIERMHTEGVRTFIEVGPKLALTNFVRDILGNANRAGGVAADAIAIGSNHPKKGGVVHANELFAFLAAWGFQPKLPALNDPSVYTAEFRDPAGPFRTQLAADGTEARGADLDARIGRPAAVSAHSAQAAASGADKRLDALARIADSLRMLVEQERTGTAPTTVQAVPPHVAAPPSPQLVEQEVQRRLAAFGINLDDIGVAGISVGLPGTGHELFDPTNWDRVLKGENLIDPLPRVEAAKIVDKNIVRLSKGGDGSAQFQVVSDIAQVIQLAGRRGGFDVAQYGVDKELAESLDRTFQYAIAAGLEALRDAGIPLQRTYAKTSQGTWLPKEWKLPEALRDETGIIFASAFPGYDNLLRDVSRYMADKNAGKTRAELHDLYNELIGAIQDDHLKGRVQDAFDAEFQRLGAGTTQYEFNRKFLFNVLSMGHSQLAQFIGARGPNTQVNAACASTTQAIGIAEDWIRTGRAKRVLVVGADDVTSDAMFEWIGAGFLASGAATTQPDVTQAALPFDKRRHGMIVGMGAVGLVIESVPETHKRGMRPIARLLGSRVSNSAFHGSRLDVNHIASEMTGLIASAGAKYGITPAGIASQTVFMSHETYTPARGGSASAEIAALRATFGNQANQVVVANTKGFTGHPQGAGVEDAIVLKCLQRGRLPPIANFKEPDPELGDLRLSKGGDYPNVRYALRLAAGFGSQVAMTLTELVARESERVADSGQYAAWLGQVSGIPAARTEVVNRTLRIVDVGAPKASAGVVAPKPSAPQPPQVPQTVVAASAPSAKAAPPSGAKPATDVLPKLIDLVAQKTGYPKDLLDPDLDMEADLGIDTVKQAELFGAIRDAYSLPQEDGIQIKDYPTLRKVAGYVEKRLGGASAATPAPMPQATTPAAAAVAAASPTPVAVASTGVALPPKAPSTVAAQPASSGSSASGADVLAKLIDLVSAKTGYPKDLLDPNLDMEADLGIDTVKQAELFGAIRDAYSLPQEEGIQIKDYPTLAKVAGYVESRLGGGSPSLPVPAPAQPQTAQMAQTHPPSSSQPASSAVPPAPVATTMPQPGTSGLDPDAVLRKVTELVAAKTGYPADMLQPDLDMEADLGIDTVKQAELFGEVRSTYSIPMVEGLQIKDYPTLRKVAGFVLASSGGPAAPASAPLAADVAERAEPAVSAASAQSAAATLAPASTSSTIVRRVPTLRPEPLPGTGPALQRGTVLLLGDADQAVVDAWTTAGFAPTHNLKEGDSPVGILAVASRHGLSALERAGALFDAAKAHRARLGAGAFVCVLTRQDGAHGLRGVRDATFGALAGLGKALKKEFPQATVKVVDVHPECAAAPRLCVEECLRGGSRTEVAYSAEGTRYVVEVARSDLPDETPELEGKHLVVSGGAQGITVELLAALAPQGVSLLLLGRTDIPAEAAEWAKLDAAGWKAKEAAVMAELKAKGEKVTPVTIQKAMSPMQKAAEVHRNLHRLQELGATVLYAPVDVSDSAAVADAVKWAREQWGRIDGVIHAAGLEISKDIASKDRAQFDQVFNVKVAGWDALMAATRDDRLQLLVAFTSVAGRFGNIGQTDYSAANEFLAKAVKQEAGRRKSTTGTSIAWGPWGEVGMATKGSILQIMHASGVTPIPTAEGVRHFLNEVAMPGIRECVVAGELGAIDADQQVVDKAWDVACEVANTVVKDQAERFRLLDKVVACTPDTSLDAEVRMDQAVHPYARDHRVDGVPYLPGVYGLESFAEAASLLVPEGQVLTKAKDVRFALPLKQLKATPATGTVSCKVISRTEQTTTVACKLTSRFVGPDGRAHGEPKLHFEGTLVFGSVPLRVRAAVPGTTKELDQSGIYPPFFHGPSFQVLDMAGPIGEASVARMAQPDTPPFEGSVRFQAHPMVVEALFQACGLRTLVKENAMSLPAGIAEAEFLQPGPVPKGVVLVGRPTGRDAANQRTFDAEAIAPDGTVLVRLKGYAMVETGPAPQSRKTNGVHANGSGSHARAPDVQLHAAGPAASSVSSAGSSSVAAATHAGTSAASTAVTATSHTEIPDAGLALPQSDDIHFAAVRVTEGAAAEPHWFTAAEVAKHKSFPAPKRADEWRAGRLAAKKAVTETHRGLSPLDVEVHADESSGRPRLMVKGKEAALWLSITHRDGIAMAALSPAPVGIDLETVEDRPKSFLEESFCLNELRALLDAANPQVDVACMWAAKEAVLKRIGIGLKTDLRSHEVRADGKGGATVESPTGIHGVRFYDVDGRVLAVSSPVHDLATASAR